MRLLSHLSRRQLFAGSSVLLMVLLVGLALAVSSISSEAAADDPGVASASNPSTPAPATALPPLETADPPTSVPAEPTAKPTTTVVSPSTAKPTTTVVSPSTASAPPETIQATSTTPVVTVTTTTVATITTPAQTTSTSPPPSTTSTTSTTATPARQWGEAVLWVADHESGNVSEWTRVSVSGDADARVTDEIAHSGRFANALTIRDADGGPTSPGVRMAVEEVLPVPDQDPENLPTEAYYSVYYYFPQVVDSTWWNIYQWKQAYLRSDGSQSRHPVYTVNPELRSDGSMYLKLRSKVGPAGDYVQPGSTLATSSVALPIQSWVHLECLYRWSQAPDGRIACWQDGVLLWDVSGVVTEFDLPYNKHPRQWTVNNYANDTEPSTHTIYIDDAAVSPNRIGPGS